jgi:GWxTD domain-containing protein
MIARCPGVATVLAAALCVTPLVAGTNLKGWRDGPVSYLLTPEEYDAFGRLKTNGERDAFIERFWKSVDKDASTPRNEFREAFESRCRAADARFGTVSAPGWRTDRGKVFILLGEPSSTRHGPGGILAADTEEWVYGTENDPASDLHIVFFRCGAEPDYRLDADCPAAHDMTSVALDWERSSAINRIIERNPWLSQSRLRNWLGALLTSIPGGIAPPERPEKPDVPGVHDDTADASASDVHALVPEAFFFLARDGSVLTLLTLEMLGTQPEADGAPATGDGSYLGAVSIRPAGTPGSPGESRTVPLTRDPAGTPRGPALFSGSEYLAPGQTYAVRYAVKDVTHDALLVRHVRIAVPHLSDGLSISSVVPAASFGPAPAGSDGRFTVGSEEVVPKPGGIFHRADLLRVYFQVYGAATDPRTRKPKVDVELRFVLVGPKGDKQIGKPLSVRAATGPSMGVALPIGDWPAGEYRVSVSLKDRVGGERTSGEAAFRIVED